MPLQPPNPEFLSQAPGPDDDRAEPPRWRRPAGFAGAALVLLALVLGVPELVN